MSIGTSLYQGTRVRLAPLDHQADAEVMARWSNVPAYTRLIQAEPVRPRSAAHIKKQLEQVEKEIEKNNNQFYFTVRALPCEPDGPERLIGFLRILWIAWNTGGAHIQLGIGSPADWGQGYGKEILRLGLRFAFDELNLFRMNANIPEYNPRALRLFEGAGFVHEIRRRQALQRDGKRWDMLTLGMLRSDRTGSQEQELG